MKSSHRKRPVAWSSREATSLLFSADIARVSSANSPEKSCPQFSLCQNEYPCRSRRALVLRRKIPADIFASVAQLVEQLTLKRQWVPKM
jgi:hypothetical protein